MGLSKSEIDNMLSKLRAQYREYAEKFNQKWFNIDAFEERYMMAIENRMNLEGFVLAEISNFEKIKDTYDEKKKSKSFTDKVDKLIEENTAKIKKYPRIEFHPLENMEISYFYGAMAEFAQFYFPVFGLIILDHNLRESISHFELKLDLLAVPRGNTHPKRINDHIFLLSSKGIPPIDIEKDKNDYLKECAFLLHDVISFCDDLIQFRDSSWEVPMRFDKLFVENSRKKKIIDIFSDMTGYGAILGVKDHAESIIDDFRLRAFKK